MRRALCDARHADANDKHCISYIGTDSNGCVRFVSSGWIVNGPGSAPTALVAQAGMSILKQNANSDWPLN